LALGISDKRFMDEAFITQMFSSETNMSLDPATNLRQRHLRS